MAVGWDLRRVCSNDTDQRHFDSRSGRCRIYRALPDGGFLSGEEMEKRTHSFLLQNITDRNCILRYFCLSLLQLSDDRKLVPVSGVSTKVLGKPRLLFWGRAFRYQPARVWAQYPNHGAARKLDPPCSHCFACIIPDVIWYAARADHVYVLFYNLFYREFFRHLALFRSAVFILRHSNVFIFGRMVGRASAARELADNNFCSFNGSLFCRLHIRA